MTFLFITLLAALFYLIPTLIGRSLLLLTSHRKKPEHLAMLPISFLIGTGTIFTLAMAVQYLVLRLIPTLNFAQLFFPTVYALAGFSLIHSAIQYKKLKLFLNRNAATVAVVTLGLSALSYFIWTWHAPYSLNWDLYEHQTLVHLITQGHFSYFTSQISDTFGFNSYPPIFHLLMAISQYPMQLQPEQILQYWNVIGFFHLWIVSAISYAFAYTVTKKKGLSLLSAILGTLTFESIISFTSFFLLPQTLAAVLFISLFTHFIWRKKQSKKIIVL